jgi:ABC-type multidrug transport system ATPase subunit
MDKSWKFIYTNITLQNKKESFIQDWNVEIFPMGQLALFGGETKQQIPLLFLLGGYVKPNSGSYFLWDGERKQPIRPYDVGMGSIHPFSPFFSSLRVRESILQHAKLCQIKNAAKRTDQLLEQWKLYPIKNERLRDIQEDSLRCTEIAMTLVHHPKLLLLHYPEKQLTDVKWQAIWSHLLNIQKEEKFAVAIATFDRQTASSCEKVTMLGEWKG